MKRALRRLQRLEKLKGGKVPWVRIPPSPPRSLLFFQLNFALRNYRGGSEG